VRFFHAAVDRLAGIWDPYAAAFVALIGLWLLLVEQRGLAERDRSLESTVAKVGGITWLVWSIVWTVLGQLLGA